MPQGTGEFALPRANAGEHLRRKGQDAGPGDLQEADGRQKVLGAGADGSSMVTTWLIHGKYMVNLWIIYG